MDLGDFIEVRQLIEPYAIGMAIERGTSEELARVDEIRQQFEKEVEQGTSPAVGELDARFHQAIVDMAHNHVLSKMYEVVVEAFSDSRKLSSLVQYQAESAIKPHRKITTALQERNVPKAQRAIREHLNKVYKDLTLRMREKSHTG